MQLLLLYFLQKQIQFEFQVFSGPGLLAKKYTQFVENIDDLETFNLRRDILENADLIFIDGPHNGIFEKSIYVTQRMS